MDNRKMTFVTIALGILLLITLLIAQHTLQQESTIVLPERTPGAESSEGSGDAEEFNVLTISPKTVQAAIRTLSRPSSYLRTQTVELFWSSGKSANVFEVAVSGDMTRIDSTLSDNSVCHILLANDTAAIWYDDDTEWALLRADQIPADRLQQMPTYETVLDLPSTHISQAEYCEKSGVYCIYVKTHADKDGYADSYWISVQSGLLLAAERTCHGELIYRFSAPDPNGEAPDASRFTLPDGSALS